MTITAWKICYFRKSGVLVETIVEQCSTQQCKSRQYQPSNANQIKTLQTVKCVSWLCALPMHVSLHAVPCELCCTGVAEPVCIIYVLAVFVFWIAVPAKVELWGCGVGIRFRQTNMKTQIHMSISTDKVSYCSNLGSSLASLGPTPRSPSFRPSATPLRSFSPLAMTGCATADVWMREHDLLIDHPLSDAAVAMGAKLRN